ncbi:hypothetical protein ABES28_08655 [Bacillus licheniformis]|uniref:Uncharacterized protein n=1 Tax=Bacillus licheniformis TaxID=1402 RepID=A0AB37GFG0_BACLI|nr:hypothetical protein [Bacillus licheniformis]MBW7632528.1 hypothetical protein [Bacillus licheniformis]MED4409660.1 hypothetical protein [Bacillus licheniformis]QDL79383.1 hypothetical protein D9Y32_19170 [Bacillus licheniformis]QPR71045.1 hypothetical protein I6G80_14430 [Bacillus licheniformis]
MFRWWIRKRNKLKKEPEDLGEVLLTWPDEEIQKYIRDYFGYSSNKNKKIELHRIRRLDLDTIILGIARMKEIEESFDNSKTVPSFIAATVFMLTQVFNFYTDDEKFQLIFILVSYFIFFVVIFIIKNGSDHRSRAAQYRSLLEQVKSEKEKAS